MHRDQPASGGNPFTILEKTATSGGRGGTIATPGPAWTRRTTSTRTRLRPTTGPCTSPCRDELYDYLESIADRFDLRQNIEFETEVLGATYGADAQRWAVRVRRADGTEETRHARVLISATGIFNPAKLPDIKGLESFDGPWFHTSRWPADLDLAGKRVAIIGNGASAMQVGPEIQNTVGSLTIFQRSTHWAAPFERFRVPVPESVRFLLKEVPLYQSWYRMRLGWTFNDKVHRALQKDPAWEHPERSLNAVNDGHREYFTRYIASELGERTDLFDKVVPPYPPYGKRMLMDNGWYRMLTNDRVRLVSDSIEEIRGHTIVTADGTEHEADVLVVATGFDVLRFLTAFDVRGRSGRSLRQVWEDDDARAYLGLAIPDFPNFFCLYGPNTQPGHGGSLIFVIEMQLHYITDLLRQMADQGLGAVDAARTFTTATTMPSNKPTREWSGPTRGWRPTTATPGAG